MQIGYRDPDNSEVQRAIFEHLRQSTKLEGLVVRNCMEYMEIREKGRREQGRGGLGGDQAPQVNKKQSNNYFIHFLIYFI